MKLMLDTDISYALALEGGGAKGAYQIGAWKALREAGIRIDAVAGTSVGAMNGALIAMGDLPKAEAVWEDIRFSKVMDVDDDAMHKLIHGDLRGMDVRSAAGQLYGVLKNRGFDVSPLYNWMKEVVDEQSVRNSPMELFIVTYSLTDKKELELRARDLPEGTVIDMLLASAYLPVFRNEKLGGKRYADGGVADVLPLHVLVANGYTDIIALRLHGFGRERRIRIPKNAHVHDILPTQSLGGTLEFEAEHSRSNMRTGYFDAQRLLYGLKGTTWYIDGRWTERQGYDYLLSHLNAVMEAAGEHYPLRELHERVLPALAQKLGAEKGGYDALAIAWLEAAAEQAGLDRWQIYTEDALAAQIQASSGVNAPKIYLREALTPRRRA